MTGWGLFCQFYVLVLLGVGVAVSSRFRTFLDEKFLLDGNWIEATLRIPDASLDPADPFRNIALVYRVLGLSDLPDVAAMLAISVFGVGVLAAIRWTELTRLTWLGLGTITVSYLLALVYLSQYSKEFVSLALAVLVLLLPRGLVPELVLMAAMIAYAVTIRPYWGVVVGLYVVLRFLLPRIRGLLPLVPFVLASYVFLQVAFNTVLGEPLSFSRTAVNDLRAQINVSVGSLIVDFLPNAVALQWLNAFLILLSLIAPWPLILGGSSTYLVVAVVLAYLWGLVLWTVLRIQAERRVELGRPARRHTQPTPWSPVAERSPRPERAVALLLALVIIQAIFEPDYGSYVKHIVPMLPLFLALVPLQARTAGALIGPQDDRSLDDATKDST
ncbi:MAG TPA: hypothetical protein VIT41_18225 [Microlunatus sp.]